MSGSCSNARLYSRYFDVCSSRRVLTFSIPIRIFAVEYFLAFPKGKYLFFRKIRPSKNLKNKETFTLRKVT